MKDYKEKIEDLVSDLNLIIRDTNMFPSYNGGNFCLALSDKSCTLIFEEGDKKHVIFRYMSGIENKDELDRQTFYQNVYSRMFRVLFLTIDYIAPEDDINQFRAINSLSFRTLAFEGLSKLNK